MASNCRMCGTLLMGRPEVRQYFHINSIFTVFSVPHRLDRNSKGSGMLLYVRNKIIVLPLNRYSLPPHVEILFLELKGTENGLYVVLTITAKT